MVEKNKKSKTGQKKTEKKVRDKELKEKKVFEKEVYEEFLIRISGYDIPVTKNLYTGFTRIKGVSWVISRAICIKLGLDSARKISSLSKDEIANIENFLKNMDINKYLMNRQSDLESGESKHYIGSGLDFKKDFDIRRMKKIKSYKGIRHTLNQPVRGQRTRAHFRKAGKAMGVKKVKK